MSMGVQSNGALHVLVNVVYPNRDEYIRRMLDVAESETCVPTLSSGCTVVSVALFIIHW